MDDSTFTIKFHLHNLSQNFLFRNSLQKHHVWRQPPRINPSPRSWSTVCEARIWQPWPGSDFKMCISHKRDPPRCWIFLSARAVLLKLWLKGECNNESNRTIEPELRQNRGWADISGSYPLYIAVHWLQQLYKPQIIGKSSCRRTMLSLQPNCKYTKITCWEEFWIFHFIYNLHFQYDRMTFCTQCFVDCNFCRKAFVREDGAIINTRQPMINYRCPTDIIQRRRNIHSNLDYIQGRDSPHKSACIACGVQCPKCAGYTLTITEIPTKQPELITLDNE